MLETIRGSKILTSEIFTHFQPSNHAQKFISSCKNLPDASSLCLREDNVVLEKPKIHFFKGTTNYFAYFDGLFCDGDLYASPI